MCKFVKVNFKYVPLNAKFEYECIEYTKTNFSRGFYWKNNRKVFRKFKKFAKVRTSDKHFDFVHLIK